MYTEDQKMGNLFCQIVNLNSDLAIKRHLLSSAAVESLTKLEKKID